MEINKPSLYTNDSFPTLESLKGRLQPPSSPVDYDRQLEVRVMSKIAVEGNPKNTNTILGSVLISFTWLSTAAACFLLTFHINPEALPSISIDNEYVFIEEELSQASEIEIQEWLAEANPSIQNEDIINEISEYDVYAE